MAEKLIQRGRMWYYRLTLADCRRVMQKACTDKRESERMRDAAEIEQAKIRSGLIDPKDLAARQHEARPLADHLNDWHKDLMAKGKTVKHADLYRDRAGKLIAMVRGASLGDLVPGRKAEAMDRAARMLADTLAKARFSDQTAETIQAALATIREEGRAAQPANHYRAALRAFLKWSHKRGRIRSVPTDGVEGFNAEEDQRRVRRSLTDDELARLIAHAETARPILGMPGPLRAMAYRVAAVSGFRVDELRSLTPESFRLGSHRPCVTLAARDAKNRRPVDQPIPLSIVAPLRDWLRDKAGGESVFPLHHDTGKAIKADLEACGLPYETEDGVADFHSLRGYYVSALVRSGRSIKEVQQLARHAKSETTLKHYAKVAAHDLHAAVESLPNLAPLAPRPESLAATGTEGRSGLADGNGPANPSMRGFRDPSANSCSFLAPFRGRRKSGCVVS